MSIKKIYHILFFFIFFVTTFTGCGKSTDVDKTLNESWKPRKAVTIICGYGVGGSSDIFARIVAKHLSEYWNIDVVVKNIQGAAGAIAASQCYKAKPDGYTVMISNGATVTQSAIGDVDWTYKDFTNIAKVIDEDEILCVNSSSNIGSLNELIANCKEQQGKIRIGVAGAGGYTYLAAMKFIHDLELKVKIITYDSGAEAVNAVMGGFVDFCMQQPAEVMPGLESGHLRAIAIMSEKRHRHEKLKVIPSSQEQGINFISYEWRGISAPKNLPSSIKKEWENALKYITTKMEFQNEVDNILLAKEHILLGDEMLEFMNKEFRWIKPLMRDLELIEHK